ncbi:hypothetical protein G6F22_018794 [Rhizopus arrhizus]|nr:hypothetical protein G6F23_015438 [Rhizopus arrhizus]KAG0761780.1 hypothetical protein G6F22_018794 [Rhizopus arrhizus]KAG1078713.1 hypothetical protein G6F40_016601 [Rhizopus arrhizus]
MHGRGGQVAVHGGRIPGRHLGPTPRTGLRALYAEECRQQGLDPRVQDAVVHAHEASKQLAGRAWAQAPRHGFRRRAHAGGRVTHDGQDRVWMAGNPKA